MHKQVHAKNMHWSFRQKKGGGGCFASSVEVLGRDVDVEVEKRGVVWWGEALLLEEKTPVAHQRRARSLHFGGCVYTYTVNIVTWSDNCRILTIFDTLHDSELVEFSCKPSRLNMSQNIFFWVLQMLYSYPIKVLYFKNKQLSFSFFCGRRGGTQWDL